MNFMFPVPDASVPAVEICSDKSDAGITVKYTHIHLPPYAFLYGTFLCIRHIVVLQENDFEALTNNRIIVNNYRMQNHQ